MFPSWNVRPGIPFVIHERTDNDQIDRAIGVRDISNDAHAQRTRLILTRVQLQLSEPIRQDTMIELVFSIS
jgi:hypothetical protein